MTSVPEHESSQEEEESVFNQRQLLTVKVWEPADKNLWSPGKVAFYLWIQNKPSEKREYKSF